MSSGRSLPPHITEEDVRVVSEVIVPTILARAWRTAADAIHDDSTPQSIRAMLRAMAEQAENTPV